MIPRAGQRIGPYEILGRLGSGGMGLVFSAWDARLQRDVAIKLLREEYCTPEMRSRFLQEARAASGLNHPNICTIFDIGESGGDPYLVMELLKGQTLRARIADGPLTVPEIVRVASEIADALSVAHARGIIHRDIKPANIILVEKPGGGFGTKVLDFGLAKVDTGDGKEAPYDLTSLGSTVGTVSYMSPEQARGEMLDPRSDLFSLGVVMYEMATGQVPFKGATSALVFVQLLSHPPETVRHMNEAIPRELERVINRLLEKERSRRFQSAADLLVALSRVPLQAAPPKNPWWPFVAAGKPKTARPESNAMADVASKIEAAKALENGRVERRQLPRGESVLRPVKRIVSSDSSLRPAVKPSGSASAAAANGPGSSGPSSVGSADSSAGAASGPVSAAASGTQPLAPESVPRGSSPPAILGIQAAASGVQAATLSGPASAGSVEAGDGNGSSADRPSSSGVRIPRPLPRVRWQYTTDTELRDQLPSIHHRPLEPEEENKLGPWLIVAGIALVVGFAAWALWPKPKVTMSGPASVLVLASCSNTTGDNVMPGVVLAGLKLDLGQSTGMVIEDEHDLAAGLRSLGMQAGPVPAISDARQAAQAIGAAQMLVGDVSKQGSAYVISLQVYQVSSGTKLVDVSETAMSREQLADAIDRLASEIRSGLGESGNAIARTSTPLSKEASSNLDALGDYVSGVQMIDSGHLIDAMHELESSTTADPHFAQASSLLAQLYRTQSADVAASASATEALKNVSGASRRTQWMVQAAYAADAGGDLPRAVGSLQQVLALYPDDPEANVALAGDLLQEGKFSEALTASQKVLQRDPFDSEASAVAERSLLALDRPEAAAQIETQLERSGSSHPGLRALTSYLLAHGDGQQPTGLDSQLGRLAAQQDEAAVLDASGQMEAGLQVWRTVAAQASANPELVSAAAAALSHAALDRAMVGDCVTTGELLGDAVAYPQAADATFDSGMASALCGELDAAKKSEALLGQNYPQSFAGNSFYRPDLQAVIAWKGGDGESALKTLDAARGFDPISLTAYLRGMIRAENKQPQQAIADFEGIMEHHGAALLTNPMMQAMSQIGLARAFAATGDSDGSTNAYRRFLTLWSTADPGSPLVREAHKHAP